MLFLAVIEKKNRASFDPIYSKNFRPQFAREATIGQSLFCLFLMYIYLTLMVNFEIREKPQGWPATPKATTNVKLLYCILNSMFKRFYLQHVQLTCIIIYEETKLN